MSNEPILANWSLKRCELLNWFRQHAVPLAQAYESAVRLLEDESFPARIHLISHLVRDISERLVYVLDPQLRNTHVQYAHELDRIAKEWPLLQPLSLEGEEPESFGTVNIDLKLASMIDALVRAHQDRRQGPSNYELLFRYLMRSEPTRGDVNKRLVSDFKKTRDWFMKYAHLPSTEKLPVDETQLQRQFERFEGMLHSFVGDFFTGTAELDALLQQANR